MHCVSVFLRFIELLKLASIYKRHWSPFITHTHMHTNTLGRKVRGPSRWEKILLHVRYNNRLSDLRSVSATSVIWSECEPSITLCCTLGQTISMYRAESGSGNLWWGLDWCMWPLGLCGLLWTVDWCMCWPFIRYHISDCHMLFVQDDEHSW